MKLTDSEKKEPVENFDRFNKIKHSSTDLKAFTEKGLYMLATIIKSPKAVQTTLDIIETYAKIRDLSRSMSRLPAADKAEQKTIMEKAADILGDILDGALETTGSETTLELNLAVIKVKHTVKKGKNRI